MVNTWQVCQPASPKKHTQF